MPEYDGNRITAAEREAATEHPKPQRRSPTEASVWHCWIDILHPDHSARVRRIRELLDRAVEMTGADRQRAIGCWQVMGAGHDPEEMANGRSGTGTFFRVYSQEVLDAFVALGGDAECPKQPE